MSRVIIMRRTAEMAYIKGTSSVFRSVTKSCRDLVIKFNKGEYVTDEGNTENNYSIVE